MGDTVGKEAVGVNWELEVLDSGIRLAKIKAGCSTVGKDEVAIFVDTKVSP